MSAKLPALLIAASLVSGCTSEQILEAAGLDNLAFNHAGLTYNALPGTFTGLPQATALPAGGTATYTGPMEGALNGTFETGAATLTATFGGAPSVTLNGSVDLRAATRGELVTISATAPITGTSFSKTITLTNPGDTDLDGQFFNTNASVVAGKVGKVTAAGDLMTGQFILSQ
jgi:hypothetical protein